MPAKQQMLEARKVLMTQLWTENPIFRQVLGICSALAVTNNVLNTLLMCAGLVWTTTLSSLTVSLLREYTPTRVRMIVQVLIIAVYVIVVDLMMRAYFPEIHRDIAAYVGLIITNCIVLGRLEAYANKNTPLPAMADGFGAGLGYSFLLLSIALVREYLGFGTLFGQALPEIITPYPWTIMILPPGAFFVLAIGVWVCRGITLRRERAAELRKEDKR
ncbi:MAG: Rnf-Nqr domain containing protein [Phycisphaerae bacterium]